MTTLDNDLIEDSAIDKIKDYSENKDNTGDRKTPTSKQPSSNTKKRIEMQDLMRWKHLDPSNTSEDSLLLEDPILKGSLRYLSYIFMNEVNASAVLTT